MKLHAVYKAESGLRQTRKSLSKQRPFEEFDKLYCSVSIKIISGHTTLIDYIDQDTLR